MKHMQTVSNEYTRARVNAFRHIYGSSLTHISRRTGLSRVALSNFMNGKDGMLSLRSISKIHDLLDYLDGDNLAIKYIEENDM